MLSSCNRDELTGKEYLGWYDHLESLNIRFKPNNRVIGNFNSTDAVGFYSDRILGNYEFEYPYIFITWKHVSIENLAIKSIRQNPDSVVINKSLDAVYWYEGENEYTLLLNETPPNNRNRIAVFQFFIKNAVPIVLLFVILFVALLAAGIKWYKDTGT